MTAQTLSARYARLESDRAPYLQRARACAELTIPPLFPRQGANGATKFKTPYQSTGAQALNSLAAKLLQAILPANQKFFRLDPDEMTIKRIEALYLKKYGPLLQAAQTPEEQQQILEQAELDIATHVKQLTEGLAKTERTMQKAIEASQLRSRLSELMKQLIAGGNSLLFIETPKKSRVYRLDSYVAHLDSMGNLLELIVKESVSILTLSPEVIAACAIENNAETQLTTEVFVYTGIQLQAGGRFESHQEINEFRVPGSEGDYPADKLPWIPLRFFTVDGESYGRSYVDEYFGDLQSLEGLSKAIVQGSAAAAKVIFLVKNGGSVSKRALTNTANGGFIDGNAGDVTALQLDKLADFSIAKATRDALKDDLGFAFMMTTSIQRSGERVTAEEIRTLANALEALLGGIYSILSQMLQLPLVTVMQAQMTKAGLLPPMPEDMVQISITTGLEALGRGQDAENLKGFVADVAQLTPVGLAVLRMDNLVSRLAVARGIDTEGLIKTEAQLQREAQAQQQQATMQQAALAAVPHMAKAGMEHGMAQAQGGQPAGAPA